MCNELKVGQLRRPREGLAAREVLCVGETRCFVRWTDIRGAVVEESLPNTEVRKWKSVTKYHDFKIDDPVIAVEFTGARYPAHFARVGGGGDPLIFPGGRTSHTVGNFQPILVKDVFHV